MRNQIIASREAYHKLKSKIETQYPEVARVQYEYKMPVLADIQQKLAENNTDMLAYFIGDTSAYVFCVGANKLIVKPLKIDSTRASTITTLRSTLSDRTFIDKPEASYETFGTTAHQLYQQFIQPVSTHLTAKGLLIVPDELLGYIPFEVLLQKPLQSKKIAYATLPYLIRDFDISYVYSATIWMNPILSDAEIPSQSCIAYAPVFEGKNTPEIKVELENGGITRQNLAELAQTREEVKQIGNTTGGEVRTDSLATETHFKAVANQYRVIHLATHALINDERPWDLRLAFAPEKGKNDGFLYIYELFGMRLHAQMAVLSACNTGYGKLQRGEGVMSLARGFAQAGVPAIVMSLWTAQDQSTSEIMVNFYKSLAQKQNKSHALRNAKLAYLETSTKLTAHPYYWSAFVLLGDTQPIQVKSNRMLYVWILSMSCILFVLIVFFYRKFQKNKQKQQ